MAHALGRDLANADEAIMRAEQLGPSEDGTAEIENALWRVGSAYEKLHNVIALGLGVPALRLTRNKRGIARFESDRKKNRRRLREVGTSHPSANDLLQLDERIANHRFLELRNQMTHRLAPILDWQSLVWFEAGVIKNGGVIDYVGHHLTPAEKLQGATPPGQLYPQTVADGREIIDLMGEAIEHLASLLSATQRLEPPPIVWHVIETEKLFFDRQEASCASRDALQAAGGITAALAPSPPASRS